MTTITAKQHQPAAFLVATDIVLFTVMDNELHLLLTERDVEPEKGVWSLPGGLVQQGESIDRASVRVLREKTGVEQLPEGFFLEQLYTFGEPDRDVRDSTPVMSVSYVALIPPLDFDVVAGRAVKTTRWVPVRELGLGLFANEPGMAQPLAFDHAQIVRLGTERARAKLEYQTVATSFMDESFSIPDLRRVYESVWDAKIHAENFRRKVLSVEGFVTASDEVKNTKGRPATLYTRGELKMFHPPLARPAPGEDLRANA